ncbi:MAG: hypothetical protein A3J75_03925 [Acidobacteria bacterium RBG_16_68_9]|nr:MAG: hypothetical protein A3J75_03925 [Acidobacteria bacterium RBG_16_68_9]
MRGVSKVFRSPEGRELVALDGVDVDVADREFVCLIGPSGCGKSTLLRIIANLETLSAGAIEVHGRPHHEAVHRIGFVFQQDALLPWRSIVNNVGVGLEARAARNGRGCR